jgi:hypothetical protein
MRRFALLVTALCCGPARADQNDLTLERIIGPPPVPGAVNDPSISQQSQYRSLMSELSTVLAVPVLSPADTLGLSGFHLSLDTSFTQVSSSADYWKNGVENVSGNYLSTITVFARKGLWAPAPAFEIGAGGTKLLSSNMAALQLYLKLALHEGYHSWPIPSFAFRAAVSHLLGANQINLTMLSLESVTSKSFGLGGVAKLDPYIGFGVLFSWARSQVIDTTPGVDAYQQGPSGPDLNANTTFPDQDTIARWRLFGGLRFVWTVLALQAEFLYTLCNSTGRDCGRDDPTRIVDLSGGQAQFSLSLGLIF